MMDAIEEIITPEKAAQYLKRNTDNYRKLSRTKVAQYAAEMKAGKWQENGEAIQFGEDGTLKNGQHRLAAVVMSGVTLKMLTVWGVKGDVSIYDSGMTRNITQIAAASGCDGVTKVEAAAGTILAGNFTRVTKGIALEYIRAHIGEIQRAARVCGANSKGKISGRTSAVIATMLELYDGMKSYEGEVFFKIANTGNTVGADGYEPSSALVARRMIEGGYKGRSTNIKSLKEQVEIFVLAMNDFRKNTQRKANYKLMETFKSEELMERMLKGAET